MRRVWCTLSILGLLWCLYTPFAYAAVSSAVVSCKTLSIRVSDDKNSYVIIATASLDPNNSISGYQFDFGDRESYSFIFGVSDQQDHTHATVMHAYTQNGTYSVTARLLAHVGSQDIPVSSVCRTTLHVGQAAATPSVLVDTGAGTMTLVSLFLGTTIMGAGAHYYLTRRRRYTICTV